MKKLFLYVEKLILLFELMKKIKLIEIILLKIANDWYSIFFVVIFVLVWFCDAINFERILNHQLVQGGGYMH